MEQTSSTTSQFVRSLLQSVHNMNTTTTTMTDHMGDWNSTLSSSSSNSTFSATAATVYSDLMSMLSRELRLDNGEHGNFNRRAVVAVLSVLLCIAGSFLIYNIWPFVSYYIRSKIPDDPKRVQRRYETIEAWVISKPVAPHTDECMCGKQSSEEGIDNDEEMNFGDNNGLAEEDKECPVCFEVFDVNDKIAWSISGECQHIFHMDCIKSWLLRHTECPCCRRMYMPVDHRTSELTQKDLQSMAKVRLRRYQSTHYCVEGGLVCLETAESKANSSKSDKKNNPKRLSTKLSTTVGSFSTEHDSITDDDLAKYNDDNVGDDDDDGDVQEGGIDNDAVIFVKEDGADDRSIDLGTDEESSCNSKHTERGNSAETGVTSSNGTPDHENDASYDVEMGDVREA